MSNTPTRISSPCNTLPVFMLYAYHVCVCVHQSPRQPKTGIFSFSFMCPSTPQLSFAYITIGPILVAIMNMVISSRSSITGHIMYQHPSGIMHDRKGAGSASLAS
ncbi:hypothetical protein K504DRAFT_47950 [Pleomassaria siparia CBS 279.74]|uniref:Uncharacterized protein n=1 Tax=Pleomassaria siparia CBS 279.74 TaxID=1314801 RepID=A0A6G1K289_9PLEO|nr:hypothetical protein K504DRAFT_47950 [Pleomassaria siparia CBS 279.74]